MRIQITLGALVMLAAAPAVAQDREDIQFIGGTGQDETLSRVVVAGNTGARS